MKPLLTLNQKTAFMTSMIDSNEIKSPDSPQIVAMQTIPTIEDRNHASSPQIVATQNLPTIEDTSTPLLEHQTSSHPESEDSFYDIDNRVEQNQIEPLITNELPAPTFARNYCRLSNPFTNSFAARHHSCRHQTVILPL